MQALSAPRALLAAGLRSQLPARPARGALAVRAASTRLPPPAGGSRSGDVPPAATAASELASIYFTLGLTGASIGTYMDGIHSRAAVLVYDKLPLVHGGLHTSACVPPLLAAFYLALGGLTLRADQWALERGDAATQGAYRRCTLGTMCLSFGCVPACLRSRRARLPLLPLMPGRAPRCAAHSCLRRLPATPTARPWHKALACSPCAHTVPLLPPPPPPPPAPQRAGRHAGRLLHHVRARRAGRPDFAGAGGRRRCQLPLLRQHQAGAGAGPAVRARLPRQRGARLGWGPAAGRAACACSTWRAARCSAAVPRLAGQAGGSRAGECPALGSRARQAAAAAADHRSRTPRSPCTPPPAPHAIARS